MRFFYTVFLALTIINNRSLEASVGISPFFPGDTAPRDVVGLRYSMRIDNLKAGENVVLAFGHMCFSGLESKTHFIEVNAYNYWVGYKDMGSVPWPPARNGNTNHNQGALWVSVSDYNKEGFVGIRPVDKATLLLFPRMNSGIDNIPGLTKIENISQQNMVGKDIYVEVTRGPIKQSNSPQPNWGGRYRLENGKQVSAEMLPPGTYRLWNVKAVFDGVEYAWVVVHPAAQSRYFAPYQLIAFVTEFFDLQKSQMRLHVWNPQFLRKGKQEWEDLAKWQFHHLPGPDPFGPRVAEVEGRNVIELSNDKEVEAYTFKKNDTFDLPMNPTVQWQSEQNSPGQGQDAVRVIAVLSRASPQPVKLVVRSAGTAIRGTDYKLDEITSLAIPAGKTTAELQIPLGKTALAGDRRTIRLTFVSASPAAVAGRVTHVINLGPKSEGLPVDPAKAENERIAALITRLGGTYDEDPITPGEPVNEVSFHGLSIENNELKEVCTISKIEYLDLSRCPKITGIGLAHLKGLGKLKKLSLSYTKINDDDLRALRALPGLEELDLSGCRSITDAGLSNLKNLTRLKRLSFMDTSLTGRGLVNLTGMGGLAHLNLALCNALTDEGLKHVGRLTALRHLDLASTRVSEAGLPSLGNLTELRTLVLVNVPVTDLGLDNLGRMPFLETLNLAGSRVTDAGIKKLNESLPKLMVNR
jgi:hypothetical protein